MYSDPAKWLPCATITNNSIVRWNKYYMDVARSKMPLSNKSRRLMTKKQGNRLRYYLNLLKDCSKQKRVYNKEKNKWFKFKLNIITLTLPSAQVHSDNEIHEKCFKPFIRAFKQDAKSLLYIYKAEVQDNGNLHYHLTTNSYFHHRQLRNCWNMYVNKLGYVDRSVSATPNSTDVHSIKSLDEWTNYMVGYLSKKDLYTKTLKRYFAIYAKKTSNRDALLFDLPKNYFKHIKRRVTIKVWDCSKALMIGKCSFPVDNKELYYEIDWHARYIFKPVISGYVDVMRLNDNDLKKFKQCYSIYNVHIKKIRDHVKEQPSLYYE